MVVASLEVVVAEVVGVTSLLEATIVVASLVTEAVLVAVAVAVVAAAAITTTSTASVAIIVV